LSARASAGGGLVVGVVGDELRRPAVLAVVVGVEETPEAVVQPRRTGLVTCRGTGHLLLHLSMIGIAGDFFETDV